MEPRTQFLLFIAFSFACFALGYAARRRGWVSERWSRPMHLHTVVWIWAPVSLVAFWGLPLKGEERFARDLLILMLAQPVLMVAAGSVMAALSRWMGCTPSQRGVMILGAALSNHGFTLGAYLCYAMLEPADQALQYGIAYVTSMQVFMVLLFYPVAQHFGPDRGAPIGRLILDSFLTIRAMPLYLSVAGTALNLAEVPVPSFIDEWNVMDILFFAGAFGAYGGNGLRLRFGDSWKAAPMHGALAGVQFVVHPLLAAGLLGGLAWGGLAPGEVPWHVILIQAFTPTALNTVMVSNLFHLDARLGSVLWLWNTILFCVGPLPVVLWLY